MIDLPKIAQKAIHSKWYKKVLNIGLNRIVPFNGPHKFKIEDIGEFHLQMALPYIKKNLNHLKGLHACALSTLAEVTSGFLLISKLDPQQYRLILQRLDVEYHYQARMQANARFEISQSWLDETIIEPLSKEGKVVIACNVKIYDVEKNHLATAAVYWQIKDWSKVKSK